MSKETLLLVERIHDLIPMDGQGPCNFLTLVCTGHTTGWAASFDFNLDVDWYEHIGKYPFAARGDTVSEAVRKAAALVRVIAFR